MLPTVRTGFASRSAPRRGRALNLSVSALLPRLVAELHVVLERAGVVERTTDVTPVSRDESTGRDRAVSFRYGAAPHRLDVVEAERWLNARVNCCRP